MRCDEFAPHTVREEVSRLPLARLVRDDAALIASELVTNAVLHSLCTEEEFLEVRVTSDGWLRISVLDPGGSGRSAEIANRPLGFGGLGLKIIEDVATEWGAERRDDGYVVWAELRIPA